VITAAAFTDDLFLLIRCILHLVVFIDHSVAKSRNSAT